LEAAGSAAKDDDDLVGPGQAITVYTRNLYLGSEITPLATIPSPQPSPRRRDAVGEIQASDFPERAKVLADEIVAAGPRSRRAAGGDAVPPSDARATFNR
jgi:hypothetical protein